MPATTEAGVFDESGLLAKAREGDIAAFNELGLPLVVAGTGEEVAVQRALANLMAGRTVIVIAHRITSARRADTVLVLDGANTRFEIVCTAALATRILGHVVTEFEGRAVTAFSLDVEAVPADHFS